MSKVDFVRGKCEVLSPQQVPCSLERHNSGKHSWETTLIDPNGRKLSNEPIDRSTIVDVNGNPLQYGNTDPNVLTTDDTIPTMSAGSKRDRSRYSPLYPAELFEAEERYVMPFALFVAEQIVGVDLLPETTYNTLLRQLKQQTILCVLDITEPEIDGNQRTVVWRGLRIWCKEVEIVGVRFKLDLNSKVCITHSLRFWQKKTQGYMNYGDASGLTDMTRERAAGYIAQYLSAERILA